MLLQDNPAAPAALNQGRHIRIGRLIGMAAILVSASATAGFAEQYPVAAAPIPSASVDRPCTQLEKSAEVQLADCGTLTLNEVVQLLTAIHDADNSK